MNSDEMIEHMREMGLEPTERTRERLEIERRVQAILDEVRATLNGECMDWVPDPMLHWEVADLLTPDQEAEMRAWFTLRLTGQIDREYDQVAAAILLQAGDAVASQIRHRKPPWLHKQICAFLETRA